MQSALQVVLWILAGGVGSGPDLAGRAQALHRDAFVFDAHCDTVLRILKDGADLGKRLDRGHLDLPRMQAGGLKAQVFALWVEPEFWEHRALHRALVLADAMLRTIQAYPDRLELALGAADARRIAAAGRIAVFLGLEGGTPIEGDPAILRMLHRLGVRVVTLTWMKNDDLADSSNDQPRLKGLSPLGVRVVEEMNRLGMVVDVSHASDAAFFQVLKVSRKPVMASHSGCRALCENPRNLSDDMLRALAKNGGVVGINFFPGFLDPEASKVTARIWVEADRQVAELKKRLPEGTPEHAQARRAIYEALNRQIPRVPIDRLIEHIDHAARVAGVDHVALGSDFDGISVTPEGLDDVSCLPRITQKLLARGYPEADVRKILGENLLRVFEAAIGG